MSNKSKSLVREKLDSFSKIILATGAIQYMAASINSVNEQMKMVPLKPELEAALSTGIKDRDDLLKETVENLNVVMQRLGDYMNDSDCICAIDIRATRAAFEIVALGKDSVNK